MVKEKIYFSSFLILIFSFSLVFGIFLRYFLENKVLNTNLNKKLIQEEGIKNNIKKNEITYPRLNFSTKQEVKEEYLSLVDKKNNNKDNFQELIILKNKLIEEEKDFIEIDLTSMQLILYQKGKVYKTFKVLTKGKEGGWWETPSGFYKILSKELNKFSSIGRVWMPYSMQFFGNFFIHGWPYYPNGQPVASTYSGGCIRLANNDAKEVFEFSFKEMPVLIFENDIEKNFSLIQKEENFLKNLNFFNITPPILTASSALVLNLDTGLIYLNKEGEKALPIASLTKLMTAVVVSELIYLEKEIKIDFFSQILKNKSYTAFDLLYPLLMQSSNEVAELFSRYLGEKNFVGYMNDKAKALNMSETNFFDASGKSAENISTAFDLAKLAKYIFEKRKFIFDMSLGKKFDYFGNVFLFNIKNFNEFVGKENLIGVKNGYINASKETLMTLWQLQNNNFNFQGNFLIIILGSDDRKKDTLAILTWLKNNFQLE